MASRTNPKPNKASPKKSSGRTKAKTKRASAKKAPTKTAARRADFGAPVDGFFSNQPPTLRPITDKLRTLIEKAAPDAEAGLKWGMASYSIRGKILCVIGAHKSHVNLVLSGPPGTFADPNGLLSGSGKTGRHLKVTKLAELPIDAVRGWLKAAAELARRN
jgi:hypothetical protein